MTSVAIMRGNDMGSVPGARRGMFVRQWMPEASLALRRAGRDARFPGAEYLQPRETLGIERGQLSEATT